ncbi:MAG TPA: ribonuclease D [Steroidobacteraceae bacterium]|nr:ribonuclease D [Steroidobacteraceae bacterium]
MADVIWIDRDEQLAPLARALESGGSIGVDTEFLRERTFFPKLCLLQLAAGGRVWCVDTLKCGGLDPLVPALTDPASRKVIHAARQDLETLYLEAKRVISPVFDTQIAAGCIGLKPQIGYAELVSRFLDVTLAKDQTRTNWSKRPLTAAQLEYAADDVKYLNELADRLTERLRALGREAWVLEDCAALEDVRLYEPDPEKAWERLRGLRKLAPALRARGRALAVWRERMARELNLPRGWIVSDPAILRLAETSPATRAALSAALEGERPMAAAVAESLLETLHRPGAAAPDEEPAADERPTPEQKAAIERLTRVLESRASELGVSPEILAPRAELKALAMGQRNSASLTGWRRQEIGQRLLGALEP